MTVQASVAVGAANSARRTEIMDVVRQPSQEGYTVPNPDVSTLDRVNNTVLDVAESEAFNYGLMGATAAYSAGTAAAGAITAGAGLTAAGVAAAASLGTFVVAAGAGLAGGWLGSHAGAGLADFVFGSVMGKKKIATDGDTPARMGDPIAHVSKNAALLGAIVGAVAAVAVVAIAVATCGVGLLVLAAAAATAGFVGAGIASFVSTAGQYGANKGIIALGSTNVFFEGRPVARVGDPVVCSDHPGPMVLAEGAKTVYANNRNIVRTGHRTTCDANVNDGCKTIVETIETAVVFEIKDSRSPLLRWANVIVNLLPLPRNKRGKVDEPNPNASKPRTQSAEGQGCKGSSCTKAGDPVDVGTGDFLQTWPVLGLPGTIPLQLGRMYRSTAAYRGLFGALWMDDWSQRLELAAETVTFHTSEGTTLVFHTPEDDVQAVNLRDGRYCLFGQRSQTLRLYDRQTRTVLSFEVADGDVRRLSDIEDLNGNRVRFHHGATGLARIEHSDGYVLDVQCNAGRIVSIQARGGEYDGLELLRCAYDADGRLSDCHSHQFGRLFHGYDAGGRMTQWHDTAHTRVDITYDARGRVLGTRTDSGHYEDRFEYDDEAACTRYYDAEGGCTQYFYNDEGLVTRLVDPLGHAWLTTWDDCNRRLSDTDPLGRTTRYGYNDFGELTEVTYPDGMSQRYVYDSKGATTAVLSSDGMHWQFQYDDCANLVGVINPLGQRSAYRLNECGQLLRQDRPDGSQIRLDYDQMRRLSRITLADGSEHRLRKDLFGRVLESVDALGQRTGYAYTAGHAQPRGSLSQVVLPDGSSQQIDYNSECLPVRHVDGEGRATHYRYGAFDLLDSIGSPAGNALRSGYDKLTRLVSLTNGVGETYRYQYDAAGRIVAETDYGGITTRYSYNPVGWLLATHRHDGSHLHYGYDLASGRLHSIQRHAADSQASERTDFEYDAIGQLTRVVHGEYVVEYEHDAVGRLIAEHINGRAVRWTYDERTGAPSGQSAGHQVQWAYDINGALAQLGIEGHAPLQIQRDALGRDVQRHSAAGFQLQQQYNPVSLLLGQTAGAQPPADPRHDPRMWTAGLPEHRTVVQRDYQYDRSGNPTQIDDRRWGSSRYRYNVNNQIVGQHLDASRQTSALSEGFDYDGALNLVSRTLSNLPGVEVHSVHQQAGRVVRHRGTDYRYDRLGRLVEKVEHFNGFRAQHWQYRWDADNRLTELITPQSERWRYAYDGLGRRIRKFKVIAGGGSSASKAGATRTGGIIGEQYMWSLDQLIEAAPIYADGTVAYDEATQWAYAPGGLTPLAQRQGERLWYVVSDHIGAPRELLDETGTLAWSNSPKAWGQQRLWRFAAANDDAVTCPIRFPGQYYDEESGLHYNRHRYYDPDTAQYLSPDPLGLGGGTRPQGYVDNPNTWIDPLGLAACSVTTYRVEGDVAPNHRLLISETGEVSLVPGNQNMIWLNFGQESRATSYLQQKINAGLPGAQLKSFEVDASFVEKIRADAVPEGLARMNPNKPIISADPYPDQFGIPKDYFEHLLNSIKPGTGKNGH